MNVDTLRVSVTDRCNLRCIYCNPLGLHGREDPVEILSFDEICRVVRVCAEYGIRRIRLTGGEPLMREDIADLVRKLAAIPGLSDLALTTNGVQLERMAADLKEAGLQRVNISLDAAQASCYRAMTGSDLLPQVMAGMHKALEFGLAPVRINCVVMRDVNLSQVATLAEMTVRLPVSVRFIEYCPTAASTRPASSSVPNREVCGLIENRFGRMSRIVQTGGGGPAVYFRVAGAEGTIGFISGRSSVFCHRCTRLRLTADGRIKPCLHAGQSYDLRTLMKEGADDESLRSLVTRAIREKGQYTRLNSSAGEFLMQSIGG
jgi:GTP 3',8-cyclase